MRRRFKFGKMLYHLDPKAFWFYDKHHYDGDRRSCNLVGGSPSLLVDVSCFTGSIFTVRNLRYGDKICSGSLNHLDHHSAVPRRVDRSGLVNSSKIEGHRRPFHQALSSLFGRGAV